MSYLYTKPISTYLAGTRVQNMLGLTFGRLLVLQLASRGKNPQWLCCCSCGNTVVVNGGDLRRKDSGAVRSCGCLRHEVNRSKATIHGEKRSGKASPEYDAYIGASKRCNSPTNKAFAKYGGRGIEFRFSDFAAFLAELGRKPSPKHSLERINNNGHYEPGNVKWGTKTEQTRNRRTTRSLTINGVTAPLAEWAGRAGIARHTVSARLHAGWCDECCILPIRNSKCTHKKDKPERA